MLNWVQVFVCKGVANLFLKGVAIVLFYSEAQKPGPSLGPLVSWWSLGPLVPWSAGPSVFWSLGPLVLWPLGASDREVVLTFPGYI